MMKALVAVAFAAVAVSAAAQQQKTEPAQPPSSTTVTALGDPANPPLVPSVAPNANDSDLVKAAKATVARRKKQAQPSLKLQNKDLVAATGKLTESHQTPPPLYYREEPKAAPTGATVRVVDRVADEQKARDEQKAKELEAAKKNMRAEAEDPYGDGSRDEEGARDVRAQQKAARGSKKP